MEMNDIGLKNRYGRIYPWLFVGVFLLGISMRLINLGIVPLSDSEAVQALNAFYLATQGGLVAGDQPLYILLTSFLFNLFGSTNLLARLVPAILGCLLLLIPILLRKQIGNLSAILLMVTLAVDPSMISLSRQAGTVMPSLALTLLALSFLIIRRRTWAGICFGLAGLSGPGFWFGITGIIVAVLLLGVIKKEVQAPGTSRDAWSIAWKSLLKRDFWIPLIITIILAGSLFLFRPSGVTLVFSGFLDYLRGWTDSSRTGLDLVFLAFFLYSGIPFVLALTESIRGTVHRSLVHQFGLILITVFILMIVIYQDRSIELLAWGTPFIWLFAAWLLSRFVLIRKEEILPVLGHASLVLALLIFVLMNIAYVLGGYGGLDPQRILAVLGGILVILIISFLVAYGWGIECAGKGIFLGLGLIFIAVTLSMAITAGGVNGRTYADFWRPEKRVIGAPVLYDDLERISLWRTGTRDSLSIGVVQFDFPSMHWLLRNGSQVEYVEGVPPNPSADLYITPMNYPLELANTYRGEGIDWYTTTDWQAMDALTLFDWLLHRDPADITTGIILWAKPDLFLNGAETSIQ